MSFFLRELLSFTFRHARFRLAASALVTNFTLLYAVFKVLLVGSSGLEPPRRLRRHLGAAMNVSPFAPLNDPPDRLVPSAPALTSRLSRSVGSALLPCGSVSFPLRRRKEIWWAQVDSNHRPHAYQACALTS